MLNILRTLADSGKTVVMTIHQPRVEAYKLIDLLLMMGKGGKLVYFGPAHPDATQYFGEAAEQQPHSRAAGLARHRVDRKL